MKHSYLIVLGYGICYGGQQYILQMTIILCQNDLAKATFPNDQTQSP